MKRFKISLLVLITLAMAGCKDYLDMVPEKDIETIESIFEIRSSAFLFYNSCFNGVMNQLRFGTYKGDPSLVNGGEYVASEFTRNSAHNVQYATHADAYLADMLGISEGYQNSNIPYANLWSMDNNGGNGSVYACIRYCNIFIENIDKVNNMPIWEKSAWKAEITCLKAFYYFELMKRYGPITLVHQNIQTDEDIKAMLLPRSPVDECFAEIVRLFDEAIPDLRPREQMAQNEKPFFNKEAAYAYKARVLLYAASPLFNGNIWYSDFKNRDGVQLYSTTYDPEKWRIAAEAVDEAIKIAEESELKLVKKNQNRKTRKLNQIADIQQSILAQTWNEEEWIFAQYPRSYGSHMQVWFPRFSNRHALHYMYTYGSLSPHIGMVEMFYTEYGLPIDKDRTWPFNNRYKPSREVNPEYTDIIDMDRDVLNLHLRREPRFYASIAADGTKWELGNVYYTVEPYRNNGILGSDYDRYNDPANPQNLTGYWQKKFVQPGDRVSYPERRPFVLMRMADLYLMQAEAWNEYSGPSDKVYDAIDKVRDRAGVPPIRQAWSQYSTSPGEILNKDGLRDAIHRERMIEFVFEGHHFWDLRRWKKAHLYLNEPKLGWNIMGETASVFYNEYDAPKIVDNKAKFNSPRDYFWPIKSEETMIADIVQNPGW